MATSAASEKDTNQQPAYLDPSPLGTKEYWSSLYGTDLETRRNTIPTHTGTTWFDDADAEGKTVRYLNSLAQEPSGSDRLSRNGTSFLDLGTGNGSMLFALRKAGWKGAMVGVDYAEESVELAHGIWKGIVEGGWAEDHDESSEDEEGQTLPSLERIEFKTLDVIPLADPMAALPDWVPKDGFDVVLDKGTFDAISLSSGLDPRTGKRIVESYASAAKRFLKKPDGRMLVTSCNWTESELERWFCTEGNPTDKGNLKVIDKVPYRTFRFGGKEGSVVVGMVFSWL